VGCRATGTGGALDEDGLMGTAVQEAKRTKKVQKQLTDPTSSALQRYRDLVLGRGGLWALIKYELITMALSSMPGALGLALRKIFYPAILGAVGRNVIFGRNITIRHGHKIRIGNNVVLDEQVVLDAKGEENEGIVIGDGVMISRNTVLSCKGGSIYVGNGVAFGANGLVHAEFGSDVTIGPDTTIAAFVYLVGGGNYVLDRLDLPIKDSGFYSKGGIHLGAGGWVGSHVAVLDGVHVGDGCVLAAGAVVTRDVPSFIIAGGVPARPIGSRGDAEL
jgi:acetyltransferase-like isoleucine patch superfamily enzyme